MSSVTVDAGLGDQGPARSRLTETALVKAHTLAALVLVGYTVLVGVMIAFKLSYPDLMGKSDWLTWGRLRYAHTQGVFFGWLGNAFLAFLYYAVPRLAERPVTSRALGWVLFIAWNFLLTIPGWVLVQTGVSQPLEWGEFPLAIDAVAIAGLLLTVVQFVVPLFRSSLTRLYVSGWYVLGGLVFTLLAYPVGNIVPELEPGASGATYSGLWIHDAIGLYITPLALAIAYIVIPATTRKPIFSHFLSMIGFWLLFLVYPLNGTHHYIFSSIPMDAQKGAIVASVYLGIDVVLVVANLLLSLRGSSAVVARDVPLRFVWVGVVAYLIVSLQGSLQALMPVNRFIHFSDWVIGHAHLALIGFASFTAIGGMLHVSQRLPGLRYNARAAEWSFWLLLVGMTVMVLDLTAAGLVQGHLWQSDAPWLESVRISGPYWMVRSVAGLVVLGGMAAVFISVTTGPRSQAVSAEPEPTAPKISGEGGGGTPPTALAWLQRAYAVTALAGVGFFLVSFLALAVWPNRVLEQEIAETRPSAIGEMSASELRGRGIYIREGCGNCHSQLIRTTEQDVTRFGVPSQAWESARDFPQLWGTRRIGPDLARENGLRSRDWHLVHLYNPRHIVPDSNMPPYPWLFDGKAGQPRQEALDLVNYLESLGRDARVAGLMAPRPLPGLDPEEEKRRGMFCDCAIPRTAGPAVQLSTRLGPGEAERFARKGGELFARNCAGCHGEKGLGDGPAAEALFPAPPRLSETRFSDRGVSEILWAGVQGSAMPAWRQLSISDLRALAVFVRSLGPALEEVPPLSEAEHKQAVGLFTRNCQNCHVLDDSAPGNTSLAPPASRFTRAQPTIERARSVLEQGIPGTAMTPWKDKLSASERDVLARYLRTLYREE